MMSNFFKIALRNLLRNKVYTSISVAGLALGISSCVLISLYVIDELSYEQMHEKKERVYRLTSKLFFNGELNPALTSMASGPTITEEFPEVENFVRFQGTGSNMEMTFEDQVFNETNIWLADSTLFDVFSYTLIAGDPATALAAPKSMVLTESLKTKLFGDKSALGEQIRVNNTMVEITGVMEDQEGNTDININGLLSLTTLPEQTQLTFNQDWFRISFYTYLLFTEPTDVAAFEEKLVAFEEKYVQPWSAENQVEAHLEYHITALDDVHFQRDFDYDLPKGDKNYLLVFSLLAIFILVIASINYINLSLSQGSKRAREVGIRKTLGALRQELIARFMGESIVITILATILGLALVELMMGTFNGITGKTLSSSALFNGPMIATILGIILLVGLLAGSYPALVLSAFKPVTVLKGIARKSGGVSNLQKGLILIQFVFSLFMITGTILINDQMTFMRSMNLGYDKEKILTIPLPADTNVAKSAMVWIDELRDDSRLEAVSLTNMPTGSTGELMFRIEQDGELTERAIPFLFVDEDFINVLGLDVVEGRNFNREIATDQQQGFIINEHAAKTFGWQEKPLDKRVQWGLMPNGQASNDGKVIGVVSDFHFLSLHNPMEPIVLCYNPSGSNVMSMRLATGDFTSLISSLKERWNDIAPSHAFQFTFLDETLQRNYIQEQAVSTIFDYFAVISILIAALGLFALLSFSIQNRMKEIGVRKVLGATVGQISWILIKDFFYLLIVAFVITTPVCVFLMNRWLEGFAYDVPIHPLSFATAFAMACLLAGATISYHVFNISRADPVNALRYE